MEFEALYRYNYITEWTKEENKRFEDALATYDNDTPEDRWEKVATMLPGKTVFDVIQHYRELVEDVNEIEAGRVTVPIYPSSSFSLEMVDNLSPIFKEKEIDNHNNDVCKKRPASTRSSDQKRKKSAHWTEEEHKLFVMGLAKHGKGDWKSISRNFVVTKTPIQVASHAQKYFERQNIVAEGKNNKRRRSIHDITVDNLMEKTSTSDQDNNYNKPLLFNESQIQMQPSPKQELTSMPNAQPEGINYHHNDVPPMTLNPNWDEVDVFSEYLRLHEEEDVYDNVLQSAFANDALFGIQAPTLTMSPTT